MKEKSKKVNFKELGSSYIKFLLVFILVLNAMLLVESNRLYVPEFEGVSFLYVYLNFQVAIFIVSNMVMLVLAMGLFAWYYIIKLIKSLFTLIKNGN